MRSLLFFIFIFASFSVVAAPDNSNGEKFEFLHAEIMDLRDAVTDLTVDSATTSQSIESLESDIEALSDQLNDLQSQIDSSVSNDSTSTEAVTLLGYAEISAEICRDGPKDGIVYDCFAGVILPLCSTKFGPKSFLTSWPVFVAGYGRIEPPEAENRWVVYGVNTNTNFIKGETFPFWAIASLSTTPGNASKVAFVDNTSTYYVGCAGPVDS